MSLPWKVIGRAIEFGFDAALKIERWLDARQKKRGLSYQDVAHQQAQIRAATTVLPGREESRRRASEYR